MYAHILVPVTYDDSRDAAGAFAVAQRLASPGAKITLLHVMDEIPGYAISYMPPGFRDETRQAIINDLHERAAALPGGQAVVTEGRAGRSIIDWADANGVDCIVMASHQPGIGDILIGSTAAHVVRHAHCAVHVLR